MRLGKVVFDFDGTLADTFGQIVGLIKEIRPDLSKEEIETYKKFGASKTVKKLKISLKEIFRIMRLVKERQKKIIEKAEIFEGMREIIEELRNDDVEVGILSSNTKENIEKWLTKKAIKVDWVRSESTLFGKDKAINKIKIEDMLYVGDEVRDIEACKKSGVKIVAVSWGYNTKQALLEAGADYVVDDVAELRNFLFTFNQ